MKAAAKGYSDIMTLLLQNGAIVDLVDERTVSLIICQKLQEREADWGSTQMTLFCLYFIIEDYLVIFRYSIA